MCVCVWMEQRFQSGTDRLALTKRNLKLCHLQTVALKLITITCHLDTGIDDFYLAYGSTKWLHVGFFLCLQS